MIAEEITEDIKDAVEETMKKEGINDYNYQIFGKSESGDNYMGEVIFVKVAPKKHSKNPYNLVIKTAKRSKELREKLQVHLFYNREVFMYSTVFPSFRKFTEEVNPEFTFNCVPKMYWANALKDRETIVLENLKDEGFKLHDRKKPWNLQHSMLTMKRYGKLHAISMALKDQRPKIFEGLQDNLGSIFQEFTDKADVKKFYEGPFEHVMSLLRKIDRDDLVKKYHGKLDECEGIFSVSNNEEDGMAICHMDCWNNNFMFKYENEDESNPTDLRFLDFQLSVFDSPIKDLSYNIYATCDDTCLKHFEELLETYHESLRQSLESLGSDPEQIFSMKDLRRHWKKYGMFGLFFALTIIKIELINKDDAPSIEDMAKNENIIDGFNVKVSNQEEYDRRILEVYLHFGDNFL